MCVSSQVLAEFYSYITNPAILANPLQPTEAIIRIKWICQMPHICLVSTPVDLFERWMDLLTERPGTNGGVFDLLHIGIIQRFQTRCDTPKQEQNRAVLELLYYTVLESAVLAHQVNTIYTFNIKYFSLCSKIEAIDPSHF